MIAFYLSELQTEEDRSKFAQLYKQYKYLMIFIASKHLTDKNSVEDAVHESFIKIIKHFEDIGNIYSPETKNFIIIVTKNTSLDMQKKLNAHPLIDIDDLQIVSDIDDISEYTNISAIKNAIKSLPEKLRDVIELKYFYDKENTEIADLLSITEATVRKRLERAREKLSKKLD